MSRYELEDLREYGIIVGHGLGSPCVFGWFSQTHHTSTGVCQARSHMALVGQQCCQVYETRSIWSSHNRRLLPQAAEPFAGARWWKFDFHTHTPASLDTPWSGIENDKERLSPEQWLLRFMEARIDCVAVTDHNTSDWIDSLKNAYSGLASERPAGFRPLCLFPGVELSVNRGLVRLHQLRSQSRLIRFDQQPLHDASFADLDGALIDRFCGRRHARRRDRGQGAASRPGWISPSRVPRRSRP